MCLVTSVSQELPPIGGCCVCACVRAGVGVGLGVDVGVGVCVCKLLINAVFLEKARGNWAPGAWWPTKTPTGTCENVPA